MRLDEITKSPMRIKKYLEECGVGETEYQIEPDGRVNIIKSINFNYEVIQSGKLPFAMSKVSQVLRANDCNLASLEGFPDEVGRTLSISNNNLTSLKHFPKTVGGRIFVDNNPLKSLEGLPAECHDSLDISHCPVTSFTGICKKIRGGLDMVDCNITSFEGIHEHIEEIGDKIFFSQNKIQSGGLGLLYIRNLKGLALYGVTKLLPQWAIINKYLTAGRRDDIFECQAELIENGFEEFAKL